MKEQYSVEEILNAINDLQNLKKEKKIDTIVINKPTLRLIEEAEKTIRSKLQSEL